MQNLTNFFGQSSQFFIKQTKDWIETLIPVEVSNKYAIFNTQKAQIGFIAEQSGSFFTKIIRMILKSHRGFIIDIFNAQGQPVLNLVRDFFFFFSSLSVQTPDGNILGYAHRRFGILYKKYDLTDSTGQIFARIASPLWRLWTFPINDLNGETKGNISKRWGGALKEIFTDADSFLVDMGTHTWSDSQKAVILAVSISIDFDFFEQNNSTAMDALNISDSF